MDLGFAYKIMRARAPAVHPPPLSAEPSASAMTSTTAAGPMAAANPRSRSPSSPKQLLSAHNSIPLTAPPSQQPQAPDEKSRPQRSLSAAPLVGAQRVTGDGTRWPSPEPSPVGTSPEPSLPSKLHMVPRLMLPSARGVTIGPFAEAIVATIAGKPIRRRADPLARPVAPPPGPASTRSSPKRPQPHRRNSSPSSHAATARVVRIAVHPGYAPPPSAPTMMTSTITTTNKNSGTMGSTIDNDPSYGKRPVPPAGPLQLPRVLSHKSQKQLTAASTMLGRTERDDSEAAAVGVGGAGGGGGGGGSGGSGHPRPPSLVTVASAPSLTESGYVADLGAAANNHLAGGGPSGGCGRSRRSGGDSKEAAARNDGGVDAIRSGGGGIGSGDAGPRSHHLATAAVAGGASEGALPGIAVQSWRPPSSEEQSRAGEGRGLGPRGEEQGVGQGEARSMGHHGEGRHTSGHHGPIARWATMGAEAAAGEDRGGEPPGVRHASHHRLDEGAAVAAQSGHHLELPYSPRGGGINTSSQSAGGGPGDMVQRGGGDGDGGGGWGHDGSRRNALPLLPSLPSLTSSISNLNANSALPGSWALAAVPGVSRSAAAAAARESPVEYRRPNPQLHPTHAINLHALAHANSYTNLQRQQSQSPPHHHPQVYPHPHAQPSPHHGLRMVRAPSLLNVASAAIAAASVGAEQEEGEDGEMDYGSGGSATGGGSCGFGVDFDYGMDAELEALEQWAAGGQARPALLEAAVEQRRALRRLSQLRHKLLVARSMCSSPEPGMTGFAVNGGGGVGSNGANGGGAGGANGGVGSGPAPAPLPSWAAAQSGLCGCEQQSLLALASQVSSLPHIDYEAMRDPQYRMKLKLRAARQPKGLHPAIIAELEDMPIRSRSRPWKPLHI